MADRPLPEEDGASCSDVKDQELDSMDKYENRETGCSAGKTAALRVTPLRWALRNLGRVRRQGRVHLR